MRFTKGGRAEAAQEKARRALEEGHSILVWQTPVTEAEQIEAIEEIGWRLEHTAVYWQTTGVNAAVMVLFFRRL